jgi:hypothetical protein
MSDKFLGLINYEGDVLKIQRSKTKEADTVTFYDQWDNKLVELNYSSFIHFLTGEISIYDVKGMRWNYKEQHPDALTDTEKIIEFLVQKRGLN